jgi:hypothetical protein
MALGLIQPLTEMGARNIPGGKKCPSRRADNITAVSRMSENVGASTSRNPKGLHGLYRDNFTLPVYCFLYMALQALGSRPLLQFLNRVQSR